MPWSFEQGEWRWVPSREQIAAEAARIKAENMEKKRASPGPKGLVASRPKREYRLLVPRTNTGRALDPRPFFGD